MSHPTDLLGSDSLCLPGRTQFDASSSPSVQAEGSTAGQVLLPAEGAHSVTQSAHTHRHSHTCMQQTFREQIASGHDGSAGVREWGMRGRRSIVGIVACMRDSYAAPHVRIGPWGLPPGGWRADQELQAVEEHVETGCPDCIGRYIIFCIDVVARH